MFKKKFVKTFLPCLLLTAGCYTNIANAGIIDITGQDSDGIVNQVNYTELDLGLLDSITFDLNIEHFSSSWGSETNISLTHIDSGFNINFDGGNDFGWTTNSGSFSFVGTFAVVGGPANIAGAWTVDLYEDFDDSGVDATFRESTIRLNAVDVPEPSTLAIFALGMIGLASRRFKKQS